MVKAHMGAVAGLAHYAEISPIMLLIIQAVICFYFLSYDQLRLLT